MKAHGVRHKTSMSFQSILWRARKQGVAAAFLYSAGRICCKLQEWVIGWPVSRFCRVNDNLLVFKNRQFFDYSDNARALSEYLTENGYDKDWKIVWLVSDKKAFRALERPHLHFVTAENRFGWSSPAAFYFGATARFFFYTHHTANLNRWRCSDQTVVNLWHGCGYKANYDDGRSYNSLYDFDYMLVPGPAFVPAKARFWNCNPSSILPLGYPRYDWILNSSVTRESILCLLFGDNSIGQKLVVWLPTFRQSDKWLYPENQLSLAFELPGLNNPDELEELDRICRLNNEYLIIKRHPLQAAWESAKGTYSHIRFLDDAALSDSKLSLYSLLAAADALISDYSSAAVDYLLLDRPLAYILTDFEQYQAKRGFVFDNPLAYMPGEILYGLNDLTRFLSHVATGEDLYREERHRLLPIMHNRCEGYCQRLLEYLKIQKKD